MASPGQLELSREALSPKQEDDLQEDIFVDVTGGSSVSDSFKSTSADAEPHAALCSPLHPGQSQIHANP